MGTLTDAQDEYNETGAISADTFNSLQENDLLKYLKMTEDGLVINTVAIRK